MRGERVLVLGQLARCRIISVQATGWDCVDVRAAAEHGIRVNAIGPLATTHMSATFSDADKMPAPPSTRVV